MKTKTFPADFKGDWDSSLISKEVTDAYGTIDFMDEGSELGGRKPSKVL